MDSSISDLTGPVRIRLAFLLALTLLASACASQDGASERASGAPSASPEPTAAVTVAVDPEAKIKVGEAPSDAVSAYGSMWVANHRGNSISRIDPRNNKVVATIEAKGDLIGVGAAGGFLFTLDWENQEVLRIDPRTNEIASRMEVGLEGGTWATFDGLIWLGSARGDDGILLGFDPASGHVVKRFRYRGQGWIVASAAAGRLWAGTERSLAIVDAKTGELGSEVDLEQPGVTDIVTSAGKLWVSHPNSTVLTVVDPGSLETETVEIDAVVIGETFLERVPGGVVWRLASRRFALISDAGEAPTFYEGLPEQGYPAGVTWAFGSLWVMNWSTNDVWRLDLGAA